MSSTVAAEEGVTSTTPVQQPEWTIMVYISADHILANFAIDTLKQLRDSAGGDVVVIAKFDDNQQENAHLYRFDVEGSTGTIESSRIHDDQLDKKKYTTILVPEMSQQAGLTEFINYATDVSRTKYYCLIIWGHGIELLLDEGRRFLGETALRSNKEGCSSEEYARRLAKTPVPARRYLTPLVLRQALEKTELAKGTLGDDHPKTKVDKDKEKVDKEKVKERHALDMVGIDACSMSMIEFAYEIREHVDFMVASQEDVPDVSFPYAKILKDLKDKKKNYLKDLKEKPDYQYPNEAREFAKLIPQLYEEAFHDYIASANTGVKGITLASLDLQKIDQIKNPLTKLSTALGRSIDNPVLRKKVLQARIDARDFVFGILVDLVDFCSCLQEQLPGVTANEFGDVSQQLLFACDKVSKALQEPGDGIVVANKSSDNRNSDPRNHGLSIYLPYRHEDKTDEVEEFFAKGTTRNPSKGRDPLTERTERIQELEEDFNQQQLFLVEENIGWTNFIRLGWSSLLVREDSTKKKLDRYYCAQQVALNLFGAGPKNRDGARPSGRAA